MWQIDLEHLDLQAMIEDVLSLGMAQVWVVGIHHLCVLLVHIDQCQSICSLRLCVSCQEVSHVDVLLRQRLVQASGIRQMRSWESQYNLQMFCDTLTPLKNPCHS